MHSYTSPRLHVLVIDDSAVVREVMTAVLGTDPRIDVTTAADPIIAMEKMSRRLPQVIVLDLEMPRMDGLTFLRWLMTVNPLPVVICSALAGRGTQIALRALQEGAVEVVTKPKLGVANFLHESSIRLIEAVWGAANARVRASYAAYQGISAKDIVLPLASGGGSLERTTDKIVVIGASTGGTEALRQILEAMPPDAPGTAIVQHMPAGFTRAFAGNLDQTCHVSVKEATSGDRLAPGKVLIAPGDHHLVIFRSGAQYKVRVEDGPFVSRHRPSVDVLFRSAAKIAKENAIGVILTGMGDDGAEGLLEMRRNGAKTIAQDEATCVVFGMPREAIERGAVDKVVPLHQITSAILREVNTA